MPGFSKTLRAEALERSGKVMETGIDMVHRKMIVGIPFMEHNTDNDVGFPLAANFFAGLHILEHLYMPQSGEPPREHIDIEFMSYGGDLYTSLGIYDRMVMTSVPIHMYVYGPCMSGGSIILQAATRRLISQHSRLMIHYGFSSDEGTSDPKRRKEELRAHIALMKTMQNIIYSRCNKSVLKERRLAELLRIETYIDAETCVKYGLADEIIEPEIFV